MKKTGYGRVTDEWRDCVKEITCLVLRVGDWYYAQVKHGGEKMKWGELCRVDCTLCRPMRWGGPTWKVNSVAKRWPCCHGSVGGVACKFGDAHLCAVHLRAPHLCDV